jgi:capsular polysaccharide biosynthesis protein
MYDGLDGLEFLEYLWRRRAFIAAGCGSALLIVGIVSAFLPARYTATASVLIEPPGGNDPRAATAVSPVYLESLKTFEHLASSDTLFFRALDDLHLRQKYPRASIESLKRQMLAINKPTNTSILEISATLDDPGQAQALAQYMAEHTAELNSQMDEQSNKDILREPQKLFDDAAARLARAEQRRDELTKTVSVETVAKQVSAAEDLSSEVEKALASAKAELADDLARQQAPQPADTREDQAGWIRLQIAGARARIQELEAQDRQLLASLKEKDSLLDELLRTQESSDTELKSARAEAEAARAKLGDVRASAAFRGVRLKVLDPGIVPQRPSFPNTPLNLIVALVLSLLACVGFLAIQFTYRRIRRERADPVHSLR